MKAGDRMVFTKSGNEVDLVSFSRGLWSVERADTRKGMACPPDTLVTPSEWARMCGE